MSDVSQKRLRKLRLCGEDAIPSEVEDMAAELLRLRRIVADTLRGPEPLRCRALLEAEHA